MNASAERSGATAAADHTKTWRCTLGLVILVVGNLGLFVGGLLLGLVRGLMGQRKMIDTRIVRWFFITAFLGIGPAIAQEITPTPGTYELLEGKSMQFDARQKDAKVNAERFEWQIVAGEGARLLNANSARVTFIAPSQLEEDARNFTLQLMTHYPKGSQPSQAQINIRVHRKTKKIAARERSPWLYGTVGFGFGYLWGGWWPYPPLIVIPPPPPGEIWPPEEVPPVAVPLPEDPSYAPWIENNPDVAADYLIETEMMFESPAGEAPTTDVVPGVTIEPAVSSGTMDTMGTMDTPEPMDIPMDTPQPMDIPMDIPEPLDMPMDMPIDMPMDFGGFD